MNPNKCKWGKFVSLKRENFVLKTISLYVLIITHLRWNDTKTEISLLEIGTILKKGYKLNKTSIFIRFSVFPFKKTI